MMSIESPSPADSRYISYRNGVSEETMAAVRNNGLRSLSVATAMAIVDIVMTAIKTGKVPVFEA